RDPKNSRGSKDSKKKETSSRKKTNEKKKKKPSQDQNPETRTPREKKKEQPMKPFTVTSYSLEEASKLALEHFKLDSADALEHIVLDKGSKKFMIFGPQEKTFEFRVSSLAKKKLTPFLQELMQKMQLDLEYGVFVEGKYLKIHLTGNDIGLVLTNRKQLLFAIELILRQFVSRNKEIPRETRVQVIAEGTNPKPEAATRKENSRRDDKPGPKGQSRNKRNGNKDSQAGKGRRRQRNSDEFLINLSNKLKGQVLETGEAQVTQTFNPAERRIIHEHLHDDPEVQTDSLGDGRFKRVRISLVGSTLTNIDENNTESAGLE
ncbi:MAG: R3H domain-containing nucleic acid-binding protein, partial [Bacteriovoracaceae bacterium]